jgi:nucleotide-binding universal stress UspA family protein
MFGSIIWATDGSEHADRALPFLEELAKTFGAKILVVHVDQRLGGRASGYPALADEPELQAKIDQQTAHLGELGIDASLRIATRHSHGPADAIAEIAREAGAGLIVVGSHGHGTLASAVIGSVTMRLVHIAPCPVFAVPTQVAVEEPVLR